MITINVYLKLRKKVGDESISERTKMEQTHRYYTISHQMKVVAPETTGAYLNESSTTKELKPSESIRLKSNQPEMEKEVSENSSQSDPKN